MHPGDSVVGATLRRACWATLASTRGGFSCGTLAALYQIFSQATIE